MAQAHPRRQPNPAERAAATVTELHQRRGRARRLPGRRRHTLLIGFIAGIGVGYGLSGPLPPLMAPLLAGLQRATPHMTSLVDPFGLGRHRILVMGMDQLGSNTDVMFIVQAKAGKTVLTQIPRDTYIDSSRYGVLKANALYATGGEEAVKRELTTLLSAPIDRYVKVNIDAVERLAEAMGGVEVDVPKRMYYVDSRQGLLIDLYPGRQLLKGRELEGFLRFRHDELGDIGRMERQKLVLRAVFAKLAQPGMVTRIPELLAIAGSDIRTDLSPGELGALLTTMGTSRLSTDRLAGRPYWFEDSSYWMPDLNTRFAGRESPEPSL
jgi:LCP family protein required for cell wall assembly